MLVWSLERKIIHPMCINLYLWFLIFFYFVCACVKAADHLRIANWICSWNGRRSDFSIRSNLLFGPVCVWCLSLVRRLLSLAIYIYIYHCIAPRDIYWNLLVCNSPRLTRNILRLSAISSLYMTQHMAIISISGYTSLKVFFIFHHHEFIYTHAFYKIWLPEC